MHEANYLILQDPLHWAWIDCLGSVGTTKKAVSVGSRHDAHELLPSCLPLLPLRSFDSVSSQMICLVFLRQP